jgi:hypothetical protein
MIEKFTKEQANETDDWYVNAEEYDSLAAAAHALLSTINKKLPIGSFSLLEEEYKNLKKALYP